MPVPIYLFHMIDRDPLRRTPRICAAETFYECDDLEAVRTAQAVYSACDDVCDAYWLWAVRNRLVATSLQRRSQLPRKYLSVIEEEKQKKILEFIRTLQKSYDWLARSEKLTVETTRLRDLLKQ